MSTPKFAAYIGRFNPIHLGHISIINRMLEEYGVDRSLVVIGSSNAPVSLRHFFSYEERKQFIKKLFPELKLVGLPDYSEDRIWLGALDDMLRLGGMDPKDVVFFGGCQEDIRFFENDGRNTIIINRFDGSTIKTSATEVRDALIQNRPLDGLVHEEITSDLQNLFKEKWEKFKKM